MACLLYMRVQSPVLKPGRCQHFTCKMRGLDPRDDSADNTNKLSWMNVK